MEEALAISSSMPTYIVVHEFPNCNKATVYRDADMDNYLVIHS